MRWGDRALRIGDHHVSFSHVARSLSNARRDRPDTDSIRAPSLGMPARPSPACPLVLFPTPRGSARTTSRLSDAAAFFLTAVRETPPFPTKKAGCEHPALAMELARRSVV